MAYGGSVEAKSARVVVRMRPSEKKRLLAACKDLGVTESEFVRACVNRELAMSLDPAAIEALRGTFEKGMREVVGKLVDAAVEEKRKKMRA